MKKELVSPHFDWGCLIFGHEWLRTTPPGSSNPYDHGEYVCQRCERVEEGHSLGRGHRETPDDEGQIGDMAKKMYLAKNFVGQFAPDMLPAGFPNEMWHTASLDVRRSWFKKARSEAHTAP